MRPLRRGPFDNHQLTYQLRNEKLRRSKLQNTATPMVLSTSTGSRRVQFLTTTTTATAAARPGTTCFPAFAPRCHHCHRSFHRVGRSSNSRTLSTSPKRSYSLFPPNEEHLAKTPIELAEQTERWLDELERQHLSGIVEDNKLEHAFYTVAADRWAKSGSQDAGENAERVLTKMNAMFQLGYHHLQPDTRVFSAVIDAWAKCGKKYSAERAEEILKWMKKLEREGKHCVTPNTISYNTVISAYANRGGQEGVQKAVALLEEMLVQTTTNQPSRNNQQATVATTTHPNIATINAVMNALANSGMKDAPEYAEALFTRICQAYYNKSNLDDTSTTNKVVIDAITCTSLMRVWARSKRPNAVRRVKEILCTMERMYQEGDIRLKPNQQTYAAVMNTMAVQGGMKAAEETEQMLNKMEDMYQQNTNDKDMAPNVIHYNIVLDAWARSHAKQAPFRCEQLIEHMNDLSKVQGRTEFEPTTTSYNSVLYAWARSEHIDKAFNAYKLLVKMKKNIKTHQEQEGGGGGDSSNNGSLNYVAAAVPDTITYTTVIQACAFSRSWDPQKKQRYLNLALDILKEMEMDPQRFRPTSITYGLLLQACIHHLPKDDPHRLTLGRKFFRRCCADGMVNDIFLTKLSKILTKDEYISLVKSEETSVEHLPESWSRNARNVKRK